MRLARFIVSLLIATFLFAAIYGIGCATLDFMNRQNDPVDSGRYAAQHVYGLFGVVTEEANRNNADRTHPPAVTVAHKIAAPYAVTADVAALLSGKLENSTASALRTVDHKIKD